MGQSYTYDLVILQNISVCVCQRFYDYSLKYMKSYCHLKNIALFKKLNLLPLKKYMKKDIINKKSYVKI